MLHGDVDVLEPAHFELRDGEVSRRAGGRRSTRLLRQ